VRRWISVLDWLPHYRRADLPGDATADHQFRKLAARYRDRGIRLLLVNVDDDVREAMNASGLTELVGPDHFFATDADAVAHLERRQL
jgi:MFS superfamily sulfate permease-like transporter